MHIILASSSPFRKELLDRLHIPYDCISPEVDEELLENETANDHVKRLAQAKAQKIADDYPDSVVIGSDQCAVINDEILGKPGNFNNALKQLTAAQGQTAIFHTGLCVLHNNNNFCEIDNVLYHVAFRELTTKQITRYLKTEEPYNCAGSFKSEAYGISLFKSMEGSDPTALMGLPLIRLISMLEAAGVDII